MPRVRWAGRAGLRPADDPLQGNRLGKVGSPGLERTITTSRDRDAGIRVSEIRGLWGVRGIPGIREAVRGVRGIREAGRGVREAVRGTGRGIRRVVRCDGTRRCLLFVRRWALDVGPVPGGSMNLR